MRHSRSTVLVLIQRLSDIYVTHIFRNVRWGIFPWRRGLALLLPKTFGSTSYCSLHDISGYSPKSKRHKHRRFEATCCFLPLFTFSHPLCSIETLGVVAEGDNPSWARQMPNAAILIQNGDYMNSKRPAVSWTLVVADFAKHMLWV
jgi:hypothetical protein